MPGWKDRIRKVLCTNRFVESLCLPFLRIGFARPLFTRIIAGHHLYPQESVRQVTRADIRYSLDISDYNGWMIYFHSPVDDSSPILGRLNDSRFILDIGGNIGQSALRIWNDRRSKGIDPRIASFEPFPTTRSRFEKNLTLNPESKDSITIYPIALGAEKAQVPMIIESPGNSGGNRMSSESEEDSSEVTSVELRTLDSWMTEEGWPRVDFIKVDVEGFEHEVIKGGMKILERFHPDLFIELDNNTLSAQGSSSRQLIDALSGLGYEVEDVEGVQTLEELIQGIKHTDIFCHVPSCRL